MQPLDWAVMATTLLAIVLYGVYKTRRIETAEGYLLGERDLHWSTIGLSIMATQASAITFLSTPGQGYESGMGFAQFYFGLPLAMVLLSVFVLPIYYRLKVYTAYEYLEGRFDLRARTLTAGLFLVQRGLAAGITIYAPSIILSTILGWDLTATLLIMGGVVIAYTVFGGTKAVSVTQKQQMIVILAGMFLAGVFLVLQLPEGIGLGDAVAVAGKMGKLELIDLEFDLSERYNIWSGLLAGIFLFTSYFGTDQSQVQRYLSGASLTESRLGLLFNAMIKVPMQVMVLFIGVLVFVFYQFEQPPIHFNRANLEQVETSSRVDSLAFAKTRYEAVHDAKTLAMGELAGQLRRGEGFGESLTSAKALDVEEHAIRTEVDSLIARTDKELALGGLNLKDEDYIFVTYVLNYLPVGIVGLLIAVIFSAAMSSSASELNALATTTVVDVYRRRIRKDGTDRHYLIASKLFTVAWGLLALFFAAFASLFDNLIEAVNVIGSVFYGAILGIFVVAFFVKSVGGRAVFYGACLAQLVVFVVYYLNTNGRFEFTYLWYNPLGCCVCVAAAWAIQRALPRSEARG